MAHLNVEVKARYDDPQAALAALLAAGAVLAGAEEQVDTYFRVPHGRLKLRRSGLENALIGYDRPDADGPRASVVRLHPLGPERTLDEALLGALDVLVVVVKRRSVLWAGDVKLHVDEVEGLGSFVEVEAVDLTGERPAHELEALCRHWSAVLGIRPEDVEPRSYSDLLLSL